MNEIAAQTTTLLLMRHGTANSPVNGNDRGRALADKGRAQAASVGAHLYGEGLVPDLALVSAAVRTTQTWEAVRAELPDFAGEVMIEEQIYHGGVEELVALVRSAPSRLRTVLVVGHEPIIGRLSTILAGPDSDPGALAQVRLGMPTGSLAVLTGHRDGWRDLGERSMTLRTIVRG